MKNFLIIVVLSFIASLSASASYRADDIDGEIINAVVMKVYSAQIKENEKRRMIEELFNIKVNRNNNAEDDIDDKINAVAKKAWSAQIKAVEKEQIIGELLVTFNGNGNSILSLTKNINDFPKGTDNTLFDAYTRLGVATTVINSLRDKDHPNFNFRLEMKTNILQSLAAELSKTHNGAFKSDGDLDYSISPVDEQYSHVLELCGILLSEKGQSQLIYERY
jgi:hypothetical protein